MHIKTLLFLCFLSYGKKVSGQDSLIRYFPKLALEKKFSISSFSFSTESFFNSIYHYVARGDKAYFRTHDYLIKSVPNNKNYKDYYEMARILWNLKRTTTAEKMFLKIFYSKASFYTNQYYHSSDVPGDKLKNKYGYGSFASNYKNFAAVYLAKIYIENKRFSEALYFLNMAVNKYKVVYTCGTGRNQQRNEYDFLYASCFEGLGQDQTVIDFLFA